MIFSKLCHVARCLDLSSGCSVCECLLFCQWSSIVVLAVVLSCGLVAINSGSKCSGGSSSVLKLFSVLQVTPRTETARKTETVSEMRPTRAVGDCCILN